MSEMQQMILEHGHMLVAHKGEYTAIREMRQHMAWYTAGYPNSAAFRRRINEAAATFNKHTEIFHCLTNNAHNLSHPQ